MDDVTLDDLKSVFGEVFFTNLEKSQDKQSSHLINIQKLIGKKLDKVDDYFLKIDKLFTFLKNKQETTTGRQNILSTSQEIKKEPPQKETPQKQEPLAKKIGSPLNLLKPSAEPLAKKVSSALNLLNPFARNTVNIEFTPKAKVMLEDLLDKKINRIDDIFTPPITRAADLLEEILGVLKTPPKKERKTLFEMIADGVKAAGKSILDIAKNALGFGAGSALGGALGGRASRGLGRNAAKVSPSIRNVNEVKRNKAGRLYNTKTGRLVKESETAAARVTQAGKFAKGVRFLGPAATVISAGAEVLEGREELKEIEAAKKASLISAEEAKAQKTKAVGKRTGRFTARLAAGLAAAEAGSMIGGVAGAPFGGVGAIPGAVIGSIIGGIGGFLLGEKVSDATGLTSLGEKGGEFLAKKIASDDKKKIKEMNTEPAPRQDLKYIEGADKTIKLGDKVQPKESPILDKPITDAQRKAYQEANVEVVNSINKLTKTVQSLTERANVIADHQEQTADNTSKLLDRGNDKNIQINNVSNPTTFLATPASSSTFRTAAFGR